MKISVAKSTRYTEHKEGHSDARTPDNNDVPITRELSFAGRSDVELGDSLKPNSFLQSSDSLDNNCILNGDSVGADFDEDLDRFEEETVARFREDLYLSKKPLMETNLRAIATAVSSAKFQDEPKFQGSRVNRPENNSYTGYYSEYFDVHKPVYDKRLVETDSILVEVPRSESTGESEPIMSPCTPSTDTRRKSFRKKEISKLISYFETEVSKTESSPETPQDFKSKIFEEVSVVRDRERQRFSRRSSSAIHSTIGHSYSDAGQCKDNFGTKVNSKSHSSNVKREPNRPSYVTWESSGWRSLDHQELDCSPSSGSFEPDSLEPIRHSSVNSGFADWQSSKSQDSDCSSCSDGPGPVRAKPSVPSQAKYGLGASQYRPLMCGRSSEVDNIQGNRGLHDLELFSRPMSNLISSYQKSWADEGRLPSTKQDTVSRAPINSGGGPVKPGGATRHYVETEQGKPSAEPVYRVLSINQDAQRRQSLTNTVDPPNKHPSNPRHISSVPNPGKNPCKPSVNPESAGERLLETQCSGHDGSVKKSSVTDEIAESVKPKPKSRLNKPFTPESAYCRPDDPVSGNHNVNNRRSSVTPPIKTGDGPDDWINNLKRDTDRTAGMKLGLLSPGDQSTDMSPNIITPPFGFQNDFPPETHADQLCTKPLRDAELFNHVSVKNLRNKLSPQDEGWSVHPVSSRTSRTKLCSNFTRFLI